VTQEARAATANATIASFKFAPPDVRIAVGDSVEWTNLDPTVHTVTASRGEFASSSMHQGQTFTAQFNVPGVYPYFCEPHEFMTGTVSVTGPAPPTTAAATTTTTVVIPATRGATTTTTLARSTVGSSAPLAAPSTPRRPVGVVAVSSGPVEGGAARPSPFAAPAVVVALVALGIGLARRLGRDRANAWRMAAVACTLVTAAVHLQLRFALDYPEPIGTLLVIEAAAATVLAAWLAAQPLTRQGQVVAVAAHLAALGALAVTRTDIGLFGFHELGWDPWPQLPIALTVGLLAVGLLGATPTASDRAGSVG
jgi:plastocyanin